MLSLPKLMTPGTPEKWFLTSMTLSLHLPEVMAHFLVASDVSNHFLLILTAWLRHNSFGNVSNSFVRLHI